jgi:hypothetical protein
MLFRLLLIIAAAGVVRPAVLAYTLTGTRWTGASTTMQLQLGASASALSDGSTSWGAAAEDALALWNSNINSLRFEVVRDSTAARAQRNRLNNVMFSADIYGEAWGTGVLAVTLTYSVGTANTETDVLFNNRLAWDSYRGTQRYSPTGSAIFDFRRVAMHEFGHVLGLDHPDTAGQTVTALMNSHISSLDTLAADDIRGAQSLYGAPVGAVAPPVIITQPGSQTLTVGQTATFAVQASSAAALSYQWGKAGAALTGATGSFLTLPSVTVADAGSYSVIVTNSAGSVASATATLTVNAVASNSTGGTASQPPTIVTGPVSQTVAPGGTAIFTVGATGTAPLSYQWRKDGASISGASSASLRLAGVQTADAGSYTVLVWNAMASATSAPAVLTVASLPTIASPPASQIVALGQRLTLTVTAAGSAPLTYQWRKDGSALTGATAATVVREAVQLADAGDYSVAVTNSAGSVESAAARVAIAGIPAIAATPLAQTVAAGEGATFTVAATSATPVSYQWMKDGTEIAGATSASLIFNPARATDTGSYAVRLTNAAGSITSSAATLTVRYSRLVNLSTRAFLPAGSSLTPGFYVRGTRAKPLLIRAVGPTLSFFGVLTALTEARLDLYAQDSGAVVASNNAWGGGTALSNAFASVGAFPLAADSKDAAVQTSLTPRAYTVRVTSEPTAAGVTLAEVYDAEPLTPAGAQLVNLSSLGFVGTGDNVLTAGFVISGNASKRLLVRAVGPGLAPFGVANPLPDPQLGLVPLGQAEPIATNDDWPNLVNVQSAFTAAGAFALTPGSKDAALVITLEPGAYTVIVSGVSGSASGTALVEIYDLDP